MPVAPSGVRRAAPPRRPGGTAAAAGAVGGTAAGIARRPAPQPALLQWFLMTPGWEATIWDDTYIYIYICMLYQVLTCIWSVEYVLRFWSCVEARLCCLLTWSAKRGFPSWELEWESYGDLNRDFYGISLGHHTLLYMYIYIYIYQDVLRIYVPLYLI